MPDDPLSSYFNNFNVGSSVSFIGYGQQPAPTQQATPAPTMPTMPSIPAYQPAPITINMAPTQSMGVENNQQQRMVGAPVIIHGFNPRYNDRIENSPYGRGK